MAAFKWRVGEGTRELDERLREVKRRRMAALNAMHDACDEDEMLAAGELIQASLDDMPELIRLVELAF